ncbi:hypothetical protein BDB00DRAFT_798111, partial [Zychaea mexicana]|uniref:uncharacterized protein n=1 Tax=Zychaea mexicana TaxID=64656 RepID=UPI0022FDC9F0
MVVLIMLLLLLLSNNSRGEQPPPNNLGDFFGASLFAFLVRKGVLCTLTIRFQVWPPTLSHIQHPPPGSEHPPRTRSVQSQLVFA